MTPPGATALTRTVGAYVYLSSRTDARGITGTILKVDAGSTLKWLRR